MGYHKYKQLRNKRKKESHNKRYGMTAKEWSNFKKKATKEEILSIKEKAKRMLKK